MKMPLVWLVFLLLPLSNATVLFKRSLDSTTQLVFEGVSSLEEENYLHLESPLGAGYSPLGARAGRATTTHSCNSIRRVPNNLRSRTEMYPHGLTQFYQKYTEAYGIPVVSSSRVPDDALRRACYITRFMLADHSGIRNSFYNLYGRVGVMATTEYTTHIPEHSWLNPAIWNARARGLGATEAWPISTGAEENILCYARDQYSIEDIFLHEFSHGVHLLGAKHAISGWDSRLKNLYNVRRSQNSRWANTYALSTYEELYAEGVQSFFNCNAYKNPPDGIHNHINTRSALRNYDIELYNLILEVFPCQNTLVQRCEKSRARELAHNIKMDCNEGGGVDPGPDPQPDNSCIDKHTSCQSWANYGYCTTNEPYMKLNCKKSCNLCAFNDGQDEQDSTACADDEANCAAWAAQGYCRGPQKAHMSEHCRESCGLCGGHGSCADKDANCGPWATGGYCAHESVIRLCPNSCDLC